MKAIKTENYSSVEERGEFILMSQPMKARVARAVTEFQGAGIWRPSQPR